MENHPRRAHYVFSSHWDREWYLTFQNFRYHLVQLFDKVLDALTNGELLGPFVTDGQAILLEDYLEVRPEKREIVRQFLRQGKLVSGPWYVMPDEFLVSGEALIRNLELGRQLVRSQGGGAVECRFRLRYFRPQQPAASNIQWVRNSICLSMARRKYHR